jgi:hypothetical protein
VARRSLARVPTTGRPEFWNGQDFYISFGEGRHRVWDDAREYGFISAGQGNWYTQTLNNLFPGVRVFVCIPKVGYVGVGTVTGSSQPVANFTVNQKGQRVPILSIPLRAKRMGDDANNLEMSEYIVRVKWTKTLPRDQAIWEKGMFANQNSVARLRDQFTLDRLMDRFGLEDTDST